jgi:hypothetical protein
MTVSNAAADGCLNGASYRKRERYCLAVWRCSVRFSTGTCLSWLMIFVIFRSFPGSFRDSTLNKSRSLRSIRCPISCSLSSNHFLYIGYKEGNMSRRFEGAVSVIDWKNFQKHRAWLFYVDQQGCTHAGRQIWWSNKFCTVAPNICGCWA